MFSTPVLLIYKKQAELQSSAEQAELQSSAKQAELQSSAGDSSRT